MRLRVIPPEGFTERECVAHLRQVLRTRTGDTIIHHRRGGLRLIGPVADLVPLRCLLRRFGYRFPR